MDSRAILKIVILGDCGVGKTTLINQYVLRKFHNKYEATVGADCRAKEVVVDNRLVTLQIWDTAGQERFASLGAAYYRGADCCVLVYDVTEPDTLDSLDKWRNDFLEHTDPLQRDTFPFVVIGNKTDLQTNAKNSSSARNWCQGKENVSYFETSAKNNNMVQDAFETIGQKALEQEMKFHEEAFSNSIKITNEHEKPQKVCSYTYCSC